MDKEYKAQFAKIAANAIAACEDIMCSLEVFAEGVELVADELMVRAEEAEEQLDDDIQDDFDDDDDLDDEDED